LKFSKALSHENKKVVLLVVDVLFLIYVITISLWYHTVVLVLVTETILYKTGNVTINQTVSACYRSIVYTCGSPIALLFGQKKGLIQSYRHRIFSDLSFMLNQK